MGTAKGFILTLGIATTAAACLIIGMDAAEYLAKCNVTSDCDPRHHLICEGLPATDKYCQCDQTSMLYDDSQATCVSKPEKDCQLQFYNGKYPKSCSKNAECIQTNTTESGVCKCYEGFAPQAESGTCRIPYGSVAKCNQHEDCDTYDYLVCRKDMEDTCNCDALSVWNEEKNQCSSKVGGRCDQPNAPNRPKGCIIHAECTTSSTCKCLQYYEETEDLLCAKGYNTTCSDIEQCNSKYECNATTHLCLCRSHEHYDETSKSCLTLAGEDCNLEVEHCIINAECSNTTTPPSCLCTTGYFSDKDKYCKGNYGTTCAANADCNQDPLHLRCNTTNGDNKCICQENYRFDDATRKCLGFMDQSCSENGDCISSNCDGGKCTCPSGTISSGDKTKCLMNYGSPCNGADQVHKCNTMEFLTCNNGSCGCENDIFIPENTSNNQTVCYVKAGQDCGKDDQGRTKTCAANSGCVRQGDSSYLCQCSSGYKPDSENLCKAGSGAFKASMSLMGLMVMMVKLVK